MTYEPSELAKRIQQCMATFEERKVESENATAILNSAKIAAEKAAERKDQASAMLKAELKKIDETFR